jgi:hypothetical protein
MFIDENKLFITPDEDVIAVKCQATENTYSKNSSVISGFTPEDSKKNDLIMFLELQCYGRI